jgi:RNA polymerase sigma-70 factor (ECF subfamily)
VSQDLNGLAMVAGAGDDAALGELIAATRTDVWRLCAYLVDRQSADDLTQETFLRACRGLARFRGDAPVRAWLLSIARRTCAAEIDARARQRDLRLHVQALRADGTATDVTAGVDIDLLIAGLSTERRTAFVLTQVIGCDYAEAAAVCECPIGTIRSRVARARADLVNALQDRGRADLVGG